MNGLARAVGGRKGRWQKVAVGVATLVVLAAVPVFGLTRLGADLLPFGHAEGVTAGDPLTFDAPSATIAKLRLREKDAGRDPAGHAATESNEALLLKDWKYTQATMNPGLQSFFQNFFFFQMLFEEFLFAQYLDSLFFGGPFHRHVSTFSFGFFPPPSASF